MRKSRFCSQKCSSTNVRNLPTGKILKCEYCGKDFDCKFNGHKYCSNDCKKKSNFKNRIMVDIPCDYCGKSLKRSKTDVGKKKNFFCDNQCQGNYNHEKSMDIRNCEECGKQFSCKKSEKLRFCSMGCQFIWQSKNRSGKNSPSYNHDFPEEKRKKNCLFCGGIIDNIKPYQYDTVKYCSTQCKIKANRHSLTKPHLKVKTILDRKKIKYIDEKAVEKYSLDIYIERLGLGIEVMGDYWHCNPIRYNSPIGKIQERAIKKDARKNKAITLNNGIPILYLWETDIEKNIELCEILIFRYLENGDLPNYHSYNYHLGKNNALLLNDNIVLPGW